MSEVDSIIDLGFYGKLPTYGDFIQKRLPTDFINPWHEWLQSGMVTCRERDPEGWMSYYLNCPAWSFVLAAGVCGQQPVAGVTIPSVDRVGRYFNFTMASILPDEIAPAVFAGNYGDWLAGLENLTLSILEEEMDQDGIEAAINQLAAELHWRLPLQRQYSTGPDHQKVSFVEAGDVQQMVPELMHGMLIGNQERYGLWWHNGSSQVSAQLLSCANMPAGDVYLGLMMDDDVTTATEPGDLSQPSEVNYLDELLSE